MTGFEYGYRRASQLPEETLGPCTTEDLARRRVAEHGDRVLMRRPAGTGDDWRDAPRG